MDLKNAKKQKYSFFDAQDEAQAIELCMKRSQKTENKFAKYTSRAASFSLGLFASYSIWNGSIQKAILLKQESTASIPTFRKKSASTSNFSQM